MSTRYDVFRNGILDGSHAGLCGSLAAARTSALAPTGDGVRYSVQRSDQRGPAVEVGRYRRVGKTLTAWVR